MRADFCYGCMEHTSVYPCPKCGYSPMRSTISYTLPPGTILKGKYLVGKVLGQGGFGITYIGLDLHLRRKVAIKEYYPAGFVGRKTGASQVVWYATETAQEAMRSGQELVLREARKMSKVSDISSVVRVHNVFQENGTAYICMDFVEGRTLLDRLLKHGTLSWDAAKTIFLPIIQAMGQVHQMGLIHRDLSPDNLMIQPDGQVKILDLGAAKDLNLNTGKSSMQVAKNGFSPLEQYLQSGTTGSWSDVYSLAATMYYTIAGKVPPSALDRMGDDTIRWDLPALQALPNCVLAALKHAMAVRPNDRTQTMEDFLKELQGSRKRVNWKKLLIPAAAAALVAVTVAAGILLPRFIHPEPKDGPAPPKTPSSSTTASGPGAPYSQWEGRVEELLKKCTRETYHYRNGSRMDLYFDKQDNECVRIFTNEQGTEEFVILAEYNEDGKVTEEYCFAGEELARKTLWTRNSDGKTTRTEEFLGNGDLIEATDISYDSQGREVSRKTTNGAGAVTFQGTSTYDAQGQETYSYTNSLGEDVVSLYSAEGSILESTNTLNGRQQSRTAYKYNSQGWLTEILTYDEKDKLSYRSKYHFRGDVETGYTSYSYYEGTEYTYEYEYILGPRNLEFGQRQNEDDGYVETEYVQDIIHGVNVRTYVHQDQSYTPAVYKINNFDWNWDMVSSEGFDKDGVLVDKMESVYDSDGIKTGTLNYDYEADGSYSILEYDLDFNTLFITEYDSTGKLTSETEYLYDSPGERNGYLTTEYNSDGSFTKTEVDSSYHTTAVMTYDSTGTLISTASYQYDSQGLRSRSILTVYYYDGSYTVTEKDKNGKILSEKSYDSSGNPIKS